jgi:hypothetical protein
VKPVLKRIYRVLKAKIRIFTVQDTPKNVTSVGKIRELFIIPMWKRFGDVLIILIVDFRIVRCSDHFKIFALPCLPKLEYRH